MPFKDNLNINAIPCYIVLGYKEGSSQEVAEVSNLYSWLRHLLKLVQCYNNCGEKNLYFLLIHLHKTFAYQRFDLEELAPSENYRNFSIYVTVHDHHLIAIGQMKAWA